MTACGDKHRMLARLADGSGAEAPTVEERAELAAHLAECAACRTALDEQRLVAGILRSRPTLLPRRSLRLAGHPGLADVDVPPGACRSGTRACRSPRRSILDIRGFDDNARRLDAQRRRAFVGGVRGVAGGDKLGCPHRDDADRRGRRYAGDG